MANDDNKIDWSKFDFNIDLGELNNELKDIGEKSNEFSSPYQSIGSGDIESLVIHNPTYDLIEIQEESNKLLGKIVENTSVLKDLVEINRQTQLNTEELKDLLGAIYEVSNAKNKEEADSILQKALTAINTSGETAENIFRLVNLLMGLYNTVKLIN